MIAESMIVTTSLREITPDVAAAERVAHELTIPFVARNRQPMQDLMQKYKTTLIIVIENQQPVVVNSAGKFFFHRGLSELRILNLLRTGNDPLVNSLALAPGMSVLDCTLGLAADALVAAHIVGETGKVCGLESSPLVSLITRWGIAALTADSADFRPELRLAAGRVEVITADHANYLAQLPDCAFDVVYFDPMFRRPKHSSAGIQSLRDYANPQPLNRESLQQALRVARSRVVVKELSGSGEFSRLGIRQFGGGQHSSVQYGILCKEDEPV